MSASISTDDSGLFAGNSAMHQNSSPNKTQNSFLSMSNSFVDLRLTRPPQSLKPTNEKGKILSCSSFRSLILCRRSAKESSCSSENGGGSRERGSQLKTTRQRDAQELLSWSEQRIQDRYRPSFVRTWRGRTGDECYCAGVVHCAAQLDSTRSLLL